MMEVSMITMNWAAAMRPSAHQRRRPARAFVRDASWRLSFVIAVVLPLRRDDDVPPRWAPAVSHRCRRLDAHASAEDSVRTAARQRAERAWAPLGRLVAAAALLRCSTRGPRLPSH